MLWAGVKLCERPFWDEENNYVTWKGRRYIEVGFRGEQKLARSGFPEFQKPSEKPAETVTFSGARILALNGREAAG